MRLLACIAGLALAASAAAGPTEIEITTNDGVTIYGDVYTADRDKAAPLILLFHQAGSDARGEYSEIAASLNQNGYHAIAIDQRAGGDRFGFANRTVAGLDGTEYGYCDAYPDLEAALVYAKAAGYTGPTAIWGSSYSAALVFRLAVEHDSEVDAVLAFSAAAGPPLASCALQPYIEQITVPLLALRPQSEFDNESVQRQMAEFEEHGMQTYVADPGVHGSSMLNAVRVKAPTDATWAVVLEFLQTNLAE